MSNTPATILACCLLFPLIACGNVTLMGGGDGAAGSGGSPGTGGAVGTGGSGGAGGGGSGGASGDAGTGGSGGATGRVPMKHRAAHALCSDQRAAGACPFPAAMPLPVNGCTTDAECNMSNMGSNGRCLAGGRIAVCLCSYDTCFADTDCAGKGPCDCRVKDGAPANSANVCLKGNCQVDGDCGPGGYCSPTNDFSCGRYFGVVGYYCHKAGDACIDDSDCALPSECRFNPAVNAWACASTICAG
jgi:hypothetical protein